MRVIDRDEVRRLADEGGQIVEVLPKDEYEAGHLPGALHLHLKDLDERSAAELLDRSRPVVVYCNDGT